MGRLTAYGVVSEPDVGVHPVGGVYSPSGFSIEPILGGLRCYGQGFDFSIRLEGARETPGYVDRFGRFVRRDVLPDVDLAVVVFPDRFALQKVIKSPSAQRRLTTIIDGDVPKWLWGCLVDTPEAIDNFNAQPVRGRITKVDQMRDVVCYQEVTERRITQWFDEQTFRIDPRTRVRSASSDIVYPVRMHVSFSRQLVNGIGERSLVCGETDDTTLSDAPSTQLVGWFNSGGERRTMGIEIPLDDGTAIPANATVSSATLTVWNGATGGGSFDFFCHGDLNVPQTGWGSSDRPSQISPTTASATTNNPTTVDGESWTFDVTDIVQELIDDADYDDGDVVRFVITHNQTSGYNLRILDGATPYTGPGTAPQLDVEYTVGGAPAGLLRRRRGG